MGIRQVILFKVHFRLLQLAAFHVRDYHVEPEALVTWILRDGLEMENS